MMYFLLIYPNFSSLATEGPFAAEMVQQVGNEYVWKEIGRRY